MSTRYPVPQPRPPAAQSPRIQRVVFLPAAPPADTELPFLTVAPMQPPGWGR